VGVAPDPVNKTKKKNPKSNSRLFISALSSALWEEMWVGTGKTEITYLAKSMHDDGRFTRSLDGPLRFQRPRASHGPSETEQLILPFAVEISEEGWLAHAHGGRPASTAIRRQTELAFIRNFRGWPKGDRNVVRVVHEPTIGIHAAAAPPTRRVTKQSNMARGIL